jgi:hypothetical protein
MAATSQWEWGSRTRSVDENIDSDGTRKTRNNWSFVRFRHTTETVLSQLRESATSISAYSGSQLITETTGSPNWLTFSSTQNWTDTTYKYFNDYTNPWVGSGTTDQYAYVIGSDYENLPSSAKTTVVRPRWRFDETTGYWKWWWETGEWDADSGAWKSEIVPGAIKNTTDLNSATPRITSITVSENAINQIWSIEWIYTGVWRVRVTGSVYGVYTTTGQGTITVPNEVSFTVSVGNAGQQTGSATTFVVTGVEDTTTPTNYIKTAESNAGTADTPEDCPSVDGKVFVTAVGSFSGSATAADMGMSPPANFYCTGDVCIHSNGLEWFQQEQTWTYKDQYV